MVVRAVVALALLSLVLVAGGCARAVGPQALVGAAGRGPLPAGWQDGFAPHSAALAGRVRLIGARVSAEVDAGARIEGTLLWLVERDCAGTDPRVFIHATAPGAELNLAEVGHMPAFGVLSATEWRPGDVLVDDFAVAVPKDIGVDELVLRVGLFEGKQRWEVTPATTHDGKDRIEVARVRIRGAPPLERRASVPKRAGLIEVDGALDEPDWQRAAVLGPFHTHDGRSLPKRATRARMLWDDEALYLAFEGEDPDPFSPYDKRDDPLYDSEAYEIFIDADGDRDVYVELQSSPRDVHFDAAFAGGRRKNMDVRFDVPFETRTRVDAGRLTQEWRIPVAALRDVPAGEPRVGASWRVNLFRLERVRDEGRTRIVGHEASAWSPPLSGDFHNIARMGTLTFE